VPSPRCYFCLVTSRWQFWIDRGGTFTDCIGFHPDSRDVRVTKVLSSDAAPWLGIRQLLRLRDGDPIPPCDVRMGTTLATNALLERRGVKTVLVITRGFGDLLLLGDQTRPDLFALDIVQPAPLCAAVVETSARCAPDGSVLAEPDLDALRSELLALRAQGFMSAAVVVMHDHAEGRLERQLVRVLEDVGFAHVSASHEVSSEVGLLARAQTTVVDAYLTPLLTEYLAQLRAALPGSDVRMMQSNGGLAEASRFRGRDAVLSGPAGGMVALARVAELAGEQQVIGFDMGGTSTDVSRYAGEAELVYETRVAGVRLRTPMLDIHTIAAGGGSLCEFDGRKLTVGPESAGAQPGPLCYGSADAREIALTDVHLTLGRLVGDRFPFALDAARAELAIADLARAVEPTGDALSAFRVAEGFFEIAVESMAEAIRRVTLGRGHDVREHSLLVFGGAGGQAACAVARKLGIKRLLSPPLAGVLSAFGIGVADETWHGERDLGSLALNSDTLRIAHGVLDELERIDADSAPSSTIARKLDLRYAGTETSLTLEEDELEPLRERFHEVHARTFGYARREHPIELSVARVDRKSRGLDAWAFLQVATMQTAEASEPVPSRMHRMFFAGAWLEGVPVLDRETLPVGAQVRGPALMLDATGTWVIEPGFVATQGHHGVLVVEDVAPPVAAVARTARDPVLLEVFSQLFMSVAQQMGVVLKRTAISTNIRERMDFSCAVFDANGELVANAPHIPVHLGAMAESVKAVLAAHPDLTPGDVFVTNDPAHGGSHLPDVTVVSPVHDEHGALRFVCASRGHHADIGGITPGSMPPTSRSLSEEGVVLAAVRIVHEGVFDREGLMDRLCGGPFPARNPAENLADLEAKIAANQTGARLLSGLDGRFTREVVAAYMQHIQDNAAESVAAALATLDEGEYAFADALDDGSAIKVALTLRSGCLRIDFTGSAPEHSGNLNAPRAVTVAAVLYVLRCLVGKPIPLNSGCLRAIDLVIPRPSILWPSPERAVVAGNVETSQRIVDVLLGALGLAAASQGTMNNLTFGNARFGYYETIAGGAGATSRAPGASAVHTHMTNTRITDPEILERRFPVRLREHAIRRGSGGEGEHRGGDGVIREIEALAPLMVNFLSERRALHPFGLAGGGPGACGRNLVDGAEIAGRAQLEIQAGSILRIETPGGGGFGPVA